MSDNTKLNINNDFMYDTTNWLSQLSETMQNAGFISQSVEIEKIEVIAVCHEIDNPNLKSQIKYSLEKEDKK